MRGGHASVCDRRGQPVAQPRPLRRGPGLPRRRPAGRDRDRTDPRAQGVPGGGRSRRPPGRSTRPATASASRRRARKAASAAARPAPAPAAATPPIAVPRSGSIATTPSPAVDPGPKRRTRPPRKPAIAPAAAPPVAAASHRRPASRATRRMRSRNRILAAASQPRISEQRNGPRTRDVPAGLAQVGAGHGVPPSAVQPVGVCGSAGRERPPCPAGAGSRRPVAAGRPFLPRSRNRRRPTSRGPGRRRRVCRASPWRPTPVRAVPRPAPRRRRRRRSG